LNVTDTEKKIMTIVSIQEIKINCPRGKRLIGIDLGSKTIGLSLSDVSLMIASPYKTLKKGKFTLDAKILKKIIDEETVFGLIMGLPLNMDGQEGPRCQATRQFAENLLGVMDIEIAFWDERLSTSAINRMLVDQIDMTRGRRNEVVDKLAATYILQGALDYKLPNL